MIDSILNANYSKLAVAIIVMLVLACPGMAALAIYAPTVFWALDAARLWPLALSIPLPLFVLNSCIVYMWWWNSPGVTKKEETMQATLLGAAVLCVLPVYVPLALRICAGSKLTVGAAIIIAVSLNVGCLLPQVFSLITMSKRKRLVYN